eukprot:1152020-Pelagomonas_calceolata.AAC.3
MATLPRLSSLSASPHGHMSCWPVPSATSSKWANHGRSTQPVPAVSVVKHDGSGERMVPNSEITDIKRGKSR